MRLSGHSFAAASSYERVELLFKNAKTWRNQPDNYRKLRPHSSKTDMKIIKERDGSYLFRFHYTDVVVWESPTRFKITPYSSKSTSVFVNQFVPHSLHFDMANPSGSIVLDRNDWNCGWNDCPCYHLNRPTTTFVHNGVDWKIEGPTKPWIKARVNREKASPFLQKHKTADLFNMVNTMSKLDPNHYKALVLGRQRATWYDEPEKIMELLDDPKEGWETLIRRYGADTHNLKQVVLDAIYITYDCIDIQELPTVKWKEIGPLRRTNARHWRSIERYQKGK